MLFDVCLCLLCVDGACVICAGLCVYCALCVVLLCAVSVVVFSGWCVLRVVYVVGAVCCCVVVCCVLFVVC